MDRIKEEALPLLENFDDDADSESLEELVAENDLLMEAYFMGASSKEELKAYVAGEKDSFSSTHVKCTTKSEHRMRCNVCGQIFCYTDADLRENQTHRKWAKVHAFGSLFGTRLDMYGQQNQMQAELDKIVDYSRCPNCKSTNLSDISREELGRPKSESENSEVQQKAGNVAEELKQFKELLDMGIITQDEFDAKKKQLLGL